MRGVGIYGGMAPEQVIGCMGAGKSAGTVAETARMVVALRTAIVASRAARGVPAAMAPAPAGGELPCWHAEHDCAEHADTVHTWRDGHGGSWDVRECEVCGHTWDRPALLAVPSGSHGPASSSELGS